MRRGRRGAGPVLTRRSCSAGLRCRQAALLCHAGTARMLPAHPRQEEVDAVLGRAVIATGDPAKIEEGIAFIRERVQPVVDSLPGSHGLGMWVNRETGQFVVSTVWEDEASLLASDERMSPFRAEGLAMMGAPEARIEIHEPAAFAQTKPSE